MGYRFASFLIRFLLSLVARIEVIGGDRIPAAGAFIAVSNHLGRLDAALPFCVVRREAVAMMVAEKYKKSAFFRWLVKLLDAFWVDRFNADLSALREALNRLRRGQVLVMAPEGTRSPNGRLIVGRPGVAYVAAKSGVPIVPIGVTGTEDEKVAASLRRLRRARILCNVGEPFTLPPLQGKASQETLKAYTDEIMCRIAAQLPPEYRGVYAEHPRVRELLGNLTGF